MHTLNLGILAHVDAGKTSLTERLLHAAGVIDAVGSVDDGSTQTDTLALERQRGITIKSAVVSFAVDGTTVNLIDTPGHPDFIAEVERVLGVLDGAVLVVSAVEGVQAQTRVLMRTLRRLSIPTLVFVNKIDRRGADDGRVLRAIAEKLSPSAVAMGSVAAIGTRGAAFTPYTAADTAFTTRLVDVLADHDDAFVADYVADEAAASYRRLRAGLAAQTARSRAHPVFFGSAITGAGVAALTEGIRELLPAARGDADGPLSGAVFKVERGPAGERIAYARIFSGTLRTRERVELGPTEAKVTAISVFEQGAAVPRPSVPAGRIARLWGLGEVRVGDPIGIPRRADTGVLHFAPPTLETVVVPRSRADRARLHLALTQLAEQDPLIDLRRDDVRQELSVSLYGEVQKEVVQATLADDFGIDVGFQETTTICVERPAGTGEAAEAMGEDANPFLATVGLRVEPAPAGAGTSFRLGIELGALPLAFVKAIEDTVRETLCQGLHGWEVVDTVVTLTRSGYAPRQSHAHARFDKSMSSTGEDFRKLTPLVLMAALRRAGTRVHEPLHRFRIELPADTAGPLLPLLARLGAVPRPPVVQGPSAAVEGEIPAARVHTLEQRLPGLTRGEGLLESAFARYEPVRGPVPERPRSDHDPLDRKGYLLRVQRRTGGREQA
ncbi:elongation factor G [Allonocardiopsis opalescens]|uniref:Ribosomal protection tetracycline resistance protein n=1 Tax=Allonocardiopsis opalescens TaxID=1144618 RepID=A0A2T0Q5C2_9ACTN|nr:TetM/TetW/TetO/TetS family tetracycline resistance ribosomal protection protein [Allonocardiopsis opalescens]PRX98969.1 ribosomal protection tetracycline resistance protein [Allonocardiopsis opalescens]